MAWLSNAMQGSKCSLQGLNNLFEGSYISQRLGITKHELGTNETTLVNSIRQFMLEDILRVSLAHKHAWLG